MACRRVLSSTPLLVRGSETGGTSHMSDNRHMSVAMQRLVYFISMVTQQYVTTQQYRWRVSLPIVNDRPVLSSERVPHIGKPAAVW
jgi:hypothetical protein